MDHHPVSRRRLLRLSDFAFGGHFFVTYAVVTEQALGNPVMSSIEVKFVMDGNILDSLVFSVDRADLFSAIDESDADLTDGLRGPHDGGTAAPVVAGTQDNAKSFWKTEWEGPTPE